MNLDELQTARDRERQTDKLQQLRASFYTDAGEFIQQLHTERDRAAERADDPFDSPEVSRLTDEIQTAEQTVEAIYEKRVGKLVKAASFAAADLPAEVDGMTEEETELFDTLVADIKQNRERVLAVLAGEADPAGGDGATTAEGNVPPVVEDAREQPEPARGATAGDGSDPRPAGGDGTQPAGGDGTQPAGGDGTQPAGGDGPRQRAHASDADGGKQAEGSEPAATEQPDDFTAAAMGDGTAGEDGGTQPPETTRQGQRADGTERDSRTTADEGTAGSGTVVASAGESGGQQVERETVRITSDVDTFVGYDDREYDLVENDIVQLPATNAGPLLERGVAEKLDP